MTTSAIESQPKGLAPKWKVLISVVFGVFMVILDSTVINVAFRTITTDFKVGVNDAQWILSIYVLALGIFTPVSGFMADRFGLKKTYITGLAIFVLGSFLCGIAPNLTTLIIARAIQGAGGGLAIPLGTAFIFAAFPVNEQGKALGFFGVSMVLAPALGPILGGWLVDLNIWRWIFFINIPIGLTGIFFASRWLPHTEPRGAKQVDILGIITAVVGFGSVLYASTIAADLGWTNSKVLTWFAVGGVALLIFGLVELFVAKEPLLDLRLFRKSTFTLASLIGWVSVVALFGAEFLLPLYLQILRGRSALNTGVILLPLAFAAGFATPIAGRLYDKFGPRIFVVSGFALLMLNTWQLSQLQADTPISWILFLLFLRGLALGLTVQTTFVTALSVVPLPQVPRGSALINAMRQVVQSLGVAILATILVSTLSPETKALQTQMQAQNAAHASTKHEAFGLCETPGKSVNLPTGTENLPEQAKTQIQTGLQRACQEQVLGFEKTYKFTFYAAGLALLLGLFLPGWPFGWHGRRAGDDHAAVPAGGH